MEDLAGKITLRNELIRKTIHLSSSAIPISYIFIDRKIEILVVGIICLLMILIDIARVRFIGLRKFYLKYLLQILRSHEINDNKTLFTGGTYLVIAYLACIIIFPKSIAITSMLIIIFSDTAAAIFGRIYGRNFINNKTIEGSLAFLLTGLVVVLLAPKVTTFSGEYYVAGAAVVLTTFFEITPLKLDDNLTIPVFFGLVYTILLKIFL